MSSASKHNPIRRNPPEHGARGFRDAIRPEDLQACRGVLRHHARSFYLASHLLPARVRDPASILYAFCRVADDTIDVSAGRMGEIDWLTERVAALYAGCPAPYPEDRALAVVVRRYQLPRELFSQLLEGLAWDAAGRRYATLSDLLDYAARVAGTVGAMMARLMGVTDREPLARACELGVAMQLSNIARDVGADARLGRLYLPLDWCREVGLDPLAWLEHPEPDPRIHRVVERLLDEASRLYARAGAGVALLPWDCRPGINAARFLYAAIGTAARARPPSALLERVHVAPPRRAALLAASVVCITPSTRLLSEAPLPAIASCADMTAEAAVRTRILSARSTGASPRAEPRAGASFSARWAETLDLFLRLEQRDLAARSRGRSA